jgi:WD40 repeat protein
VGTALLALTLAAGPGRAQDGPRDLVPPPGPIVNIRTIAFSPNGKLLAAGSGEVEEPGRVVVWDVKTLQQRFTFNVDKGVPFVAFSRDGKTLAVASFTENCFLLDAETGKVSGTLPGHDKAARGVTFAPDGQTLAVSCYDGTIRLYDYRTGKLLRKWKAHDDWVYCVAYSPDGAVLASSSADNTVRLWEASSGKPLRRWNNSGILRCVAFAPDGGWLATCCWDGTLKLRDPGSDRVLQGFARGGGVDWAAIHPSGKALAVGRMGNVVLVYAIDVREVGRVARQHIQALMALWDDDRIEVRDKASRDLVALGSVAEPFLFTAQKESPLAEVRIRARQARAALRDPAPLAKLEGHRGEVLWGGYSPDGSLLATGGKDGVVLVWETETYRLKATLKWPNAE